MLDPNTFITRQGILTRYGKNILATNGDYQTMTINDICGIQQNNSSTSVWNVLPQEEMF